MPRPKNPDWAGPTRWNKPRDALATRRDRARFAPATHRLLLARYEREERERRALYGRSMRGLWRELAQQSGVSRHRIYDLRRDSAYEPTPSERIALARATGILPESLWFEPDPPLVEQGELLGE